MVSPENTPYFFRESITTYMEKLFAQSSNKILSHCLRTDTQVESSYHGIIVAVDHDGPTASEVNILFPPVTDLSNTKRKRKEKRTEGVSLALNQGPGLCPKL